MHDPITRGERIAQERPTTPSVNSDDWINEVFTYHAPAGEQPAAFAEIREAGKAFAKVILENCPPCADRTVVIRRIREDVMIANAAVALKGLV